MIAAGSAMSSRPRFADVVAIARVALFGDCPRLPFVMRCKCQFGRPGKSLGEKRQVEGPGRDAPPVFRP
jgi:hypothetical protein